MRELVQNKYPLNDVISTLSMISPKTPKSERVRIGPDKDGGYVLLNDLLTGNVAYSFGVGRSSEFERRMAQRGYVNYMYDHTVNGPVDVSGAHFVFKKIGVSDTDGPNMRTIETIIEENAHQNVNDIVLQCDVEGAEFDIFTNTPQSVLKQFSQIIIEYHFIDKCIMDVGRFETGMYTYDRMRSTFESLSKNFTPYHVHGNNWLGAFTVDGKVVPEVIEVSYVRSDLVEFSSDKTKFPTRFDSPNARGRADIELGEFSWT